MTFTFDISMKTNRISSGLDENNDMTVARREGTSKRRLVAVCE